MSPSPPYPNTQRASIARFVTSWIGRLITAGLIAGAAPMAFGDDGIPPGDLTHFQPTRVQYDSVGGWGQAYYGYDGRVWERWETDFPQAERNFAKRLNEWTSIVTNRIPIKRRLTDPNLGDSPLLFMSDVGYMLLTNPEKAALRDYLERGGFLWVDDFWGDAEWANFERAMRDVLPGKRWTTLPSTHPIFHTVFDLEEMPQIPARDFAFRGSTEPPWIHRYPQGSLAVASIRAYVDDDGRLMVIGTHNTDVADGWEREAYGDFYFENYSTKSYRVGVNVIVYAMTH